MKYKLDGDNCYICVHMLVDGTWGVGVSPTYTPPEENGKMALLTPDEARRVKGDFSKDGDIYNVKKGTQDVLQLRVHRAANSADKHNQWAEQGREVKHVNN